MTIQPGTGYTFTASSQGTTFNVQQPWTPFSLYQDTFECSPYKVHDVVQKTGDGGSYVVFEICSATFNNLVPQVYNSTTETWEYINALTTGYELVLDFASTTSSIVYLRVGPDAAFQRHEVPAHARQQRLRPGLAGDHHAQACTG